VNIVINQPMKFTPFNRVVMEVIEGVLDLRYTESIREEEGGTYDVGVSAGLRRWPEQKGVLRIRFDCAPDRVENLKDKVYLELDKLVKNGPSSEDLSKTVENLLKNSEQRRQHNSFYMNAIYSQYIHGIDLYAAENYEDILKDLTIKDVKKVMKSLYKDPDIVEVVFIPEKEEANTP
jgi:zinc protease